MNTFWTVFAALLVLGPNLGKLWAILIEETLWEKHLKGTFAGRLLERVWAILAEETASIKNLGVLSVAFERVWNKGSRAKIIFALICLTLEAVFYVATPLLGKHYIDTLIKGIFSGWNLPAPNPLPFMGGMSCEKAKNWLAYVIAFFSMNWYAWFNTGTFFARTETYEAQVTFGTENYRHILNLSMDFHTRSRKGEVLKKADDAAINSQDYIYNSFTGLLRNIMSMLFVVTVFSINWKLSLICSFILVVALYTNIIFGSRVSKEEKSAWQKVNDIQAVSLDVMNNILEVKLSRNEEYEVQRRKEAAESQLVPLRKVAVYWRQLTTILNAWQNMGYLAALVWIVAPAVMSREMTIGQAGQFISYYVMLFVNFMQMLFMYLNGQRLAPKLDDIVDLRNEKPLVADRPDSVPFPGFRSEFEFRDVSFSYPVTKKDTGNGRSIVLKNVNFTIPKGKITVIKGKSGCGKTTLEYLLMRLYPPTSGTILCDGADVGTYDLSSYYRAFTIVSQEAGLFRNTIRYNIEYSRKGSSMESIIEAAKIARIHDFIVSLKDGYDTIITEKATNISVGQRRRIAIARAVLARDAEIVVLDEPTAGIDEDTAGEFLDEVIQAFAGKTLVIVTHDFEVLTRADHIILLSPQGTIERIGSREMVEDIAKSAILKIQAKLHKTATMPG